MKYECRKMVLCTRGCMYIARRNKNRSSTCVHVHLRVQIVELKIIFPRYNRGRGIKYRFYCFFFHFFVFHSPAAVLLFVKNVYEKAGRSGAKEKCQIFNEERHQNFYNELSSPVTRFVIVEITLYRADLQATRAYRFHFCENVCQLQNRYVALYLRPFDRACYQRSTKKHPPIES